MNHGTENVKRSTIERAKARERRTLIFVANWSVFRGFVQAIPKARLRVTRVNSWLLGHKCTRIFHGVFTAITGQIKFNEPAFCGPILIFKIYAWIRIYLLTMLVMGSTVSIKILNYMIYDMISIELDNFF